jgi:hypothetical protein
MTEKKPGSGAKRQLFSGQEQWRSEKTSRPTSLNIHNPDYRHFFFFKGMYVASGSRLECHLTMSKMRICYLHSDVILFLKLSEMDYSCSDNIMYARHAELASDLSCNRNIGV